MAYVLYGGLTPGLQAEVRDLYPDLSEVRRHDFEFWVRADGHMSRRGGHHQLSEAAYQREMERYKAAPRSKGDLLGWRPGTTFHFSGK